MLILDHYIFNIDTAMLQQRTNENGEYYTIVVEKNYVFHVNMPMQKLLDINLRYYGSSYRGARDGSRAILGNIQIYPIAISMLEKVIWLPSESIKSPNRVWFALHCIHYPELKPCGDQTSITLTSGLQFTIPVQHKNFIKPYNNALLLKAKMDQRIHHMPQLIADRFEEYKIEDIDLYE